MTTTQTVTNANILPGDVLADDRFAGATVTRVVTKGGRTVLTLDVSAISGARIERDVYSAYGSTQVTR